MEEAAQPQMLHPPSHGAASRKPRKPTPDHPPYAEMVRVALSTLKEEGGSTEASISAFILSAYSDGLPAGHHRLLPYYLRKLLAAGDLISPSPSRYLLRPRPPLPPSPPPLSLSTIPSCRRGRPPKRPTNAAAGNGSLSLWPAAASEVSGSGVPRRHHGRPPNTATATNGSAAASAAPPLRRGRGRPRKYPPNPGVVHSEVRIPRASEPTSAGDRQIPGRRLVIRLRRRPPEPGDSAAGDAAAGGETPAPRKRCSSECSGTGNVGSVSGETQTEPDRKLLPPASAPPPELEEKTVVLIQEPLECEGTSSSNAQSHPLVALSQPGTSQEALPPAVVKLEPHEQLLPRSPPQFEPSEEFLMLDPMQLELDDELRPLLLMQLDAEEGSPPPAQTQTELDEKPLLLAPAPQQQPEHAEDPPLALPTEIKEDPPSPAPVLPEPADEPLPPPPLPPPKPEEEMLPVASLQPEPSEAVLSQLGTAEEPESKDESSPPARIPPPAVSQKDAAPGKHRKTPSRRRKLWYEC